MTSLDFGRLRRWWLSLGLLLLGVASGLGAVGDLALMLALLAAFASVAFVTGVARPDPPKPVRDPDPVPRGDQA